VIADVVEKSHYGQFTMHPEGKSLPVFEYATDRWRVYFQSRTNQENCKYHGRE